MDPTYLYHGQDMMSLLVKAVMFLKNLQNETDLGPRVVMGMIMAGLWPRPEMCGWNTGRRPSALNQPTVHAFSNLSSEEMKMYCVIDLVD